MYFPVSGIEVNPLIPPLVSFVISSVTASAGISGSFLLLPFQMSVLNYTSPSVTPTNLIYNIFAIPGGLYRFIRDGRISWPLTIIIMTGTLPGVFFGSLARVYLLPDLKRFQLFVAAVLLYFGIMLIFEYVVRSKKQNARHGSLDQKFKEHIAKMENLTNKKITPGLPTDAIINTKVFSIKKIEYEFWGETYSIKTATIFFLALAVGLIGGIYGIGGGAIIAPFCVLVLGLPVYTVAGAALAGNFMTSTAGVIFYIFLASTPAGTSANISPDWSLGALFGVGGLLGTYFGAYFQKYLKQVVVGRIMALLVMLLALNYIIQYFIKS